MCKKINYGYYKSTVKYLRNDMLQEPSAGEKSQNHSLEG